MVNSFPSTLRNLLPRFIELAHTHLARALPFYESACLLSNADFDVPAPVEEDSQVASDLPGLMATILDFLCQTVKRKNARSLFVGPDEGGPTQLLYSMTDSAIAYARMTTDDVSPCACVASCRADAGFSRY